MPGDVIGAALPPPRPGPRGSSECHRRFMVRVFFILCTLITLLSPCFCHSLPVTFDPYYAFLGLVAVNPWMVFRCENVTQPGSIPWTSVNYSSFKLEIGFEWGTTRISIRTFIILNIHQ